MATSFFILHGEQLVTSRQKLTELLGTFKNQGLEITRLEAKTLDSSSLEEVLGRSNLFGSDQAVVIEGLHSLPTSARKKELLALVATSAITTVLWEKRALTATMLKKFPQAQVQEFKPTSHVFKWLDSLTGQAANSKQQLGLLHAAIKQDGAELCFHLLVRQVRLLLNAKVGNPLKGAPFMVTKIRKQAQNFSLPQLLAFHTQLFMIEKRVKTGEAQLDLTRTLDLLTLGL